jgi:hypothetical protein
MRVGLLLADWLVRLKSIHPDKPDNPDYPIRGQRNVELSIRTS